MKICCTSSHRGGEAKKRGGELSSASSLLLSHVHFVEALVALVQDKLLNLVKFQVLHGSATILPSLCQLATKHTKGRCHAYKCLAGYSFLFVRLSRCCLSAVCLDLVHDSQPRPGRPSTGSVKSTRTPDPDFCRTDKDPFRSAVFCTPGCVRRLFSKTQQQLVNVCSTSVECLHART